MKLIGRGSYSNVFKCEDVESGTSFAVKGPRSPTARSACLSPQGRKDAAMLQSLLHENVVEHRHGCADGSMIMEFLDGGSLLDVMERNGGKLSETEVSRLTAHILSGVKYLHSQGVTHKDIKPANIFYDTASSTAKVGDIAVEAEVSSAKRSGIVVPVGTPSFLAPEVVRSGKHEQVSDIWAIGCTVLQLVTGKIPWDEEDSAFSAMFKIGSGQHPSIPSDLSPDLASFLSSCFLAADARPTAAELLAHAFVADMPPAGPM